MGVCLHICPGRTGRDYLNHDGCKLSELPALHEATKRHYKSEEFRSYFGCFTGSSVMTYSKQCAMLRASLEGKLFLTAKMQKKVL